MDRAARDSSGITMATPRSWTASCVNRDVHCSADGPQAAPIENRQFRSNAVSLTQNFRQKGSPPIIIFARIVRPMNVLQLCR